MKNYELTYLVNTELSEEDVNELSSKILGLITKEGGSIIKTAKTEKRRLGKEILDKKEAFLILTEFSSDPQKINTIKKGVDSESSILRSTIMVKIKEREFPEADTAKPKETKSKKVELEKIDEKIDEILK